MPLPEMAGCSLWGSESGRVLAQENNATAVERQMRFVPFFAREQDQGNLSLEKLVSQVCRKLLVICLNVW